MSFVKTDTVKNKIRKNELAQNLLLIRATEKTFEARR